MLVSNNVSQDNPQSEKHAPRGWRESTQRRTSPTRKRQRRILGIMSVLLFIILIFAAVRLAAFATASNDELQLRVGNQQVVTLDLRQSLSINPDILGANVFPQIGTSSQDKASGFMDYSNPLSTGLQDAHVKLLRFPGGKWGEDHLLTLDQLSAFSTLLNETNADGMVQVRVSGPTTGGFNELTALTSRIQLATRWIDFMNNPQSDQRIARYAHAPFHRVKYWTVGDEPDKLINPVTNQPYLVKDYVSDFIQFSTAMHRTDPTIKVFGPELSEFYGPGAGPVDANGTLWMEGFLKGVGEYEQANHVVLLDGVSFHRFQFVGATQTPYLFLSSTGEWNYLLPALHQLISQNLHRDVPIAITEINTNTNTEQQQLPTPGLAALWWADTLATLMNQQVEYVAFSSASGVNMPYPLFTTDGLQPTPMLRVMQVLGQLQHNLIPLEVQRDPVSVYATQDNGHQTVSLLFINKSSESQLAQISGGSNLIGISPWADLDVSLSAHSIIAVTLHRNSTAEAYSYIVPAANDSQTAAPVLHTICGHKTDTLANTIPC
ncbi:MAG: hypothetical protein ACJ795_07425 [Ktedonobacteraceae bacterium]